jgi:CheY-like chemotaxis protein
MSKRILVVEDQPDNRQIIRDMRLDSTNGAGSGPMAPGDLRLSVVCRTSRIRTGI